MSLITDVDYALQAIRLSTLRYSDDSVTPRIISLDPSFALNPYVAAAGLSDIDRWPEITRALDSPPPDPDHGYSSTDSDGGVARAGPSRSTGGLSYTQTIMGNKSGGLGMRVAGRRTTGAKRDRRANSNNVTPGTVTPSAAGKLPRPGGGAIAGVIPGIDVFSPNGTAGRPRSDSAPAPAPSLGQSKLDMGSVITSGRGLGEVEAATGQMGLLEQAMSISEMSTGTGTSETKGELGLGAGMRIGMGESARPSESIGGTGLGETLMDDDELASDLDEGEDEEEEEDGPTSAVGVDGEGGKEARRSMLLASQRSSYITDLPPLEFRLVPVPKLDGSSSSATASARPTPSGLTAQLYKHVPHLIASNSDLGDGEDDDAANGNGYGTTENPFASLYASVSAHPPQPSLSLELYFPHSAKPTLPLVVVVRKDATVEEVTGYGLYKYWQEAREPQLSEEDEDEQRWSTVGWGLRIVEDDGEVDEDFPPLDRDGQISRFSYGEFAIVEATESQIRQNAAKAPLIQRRPSRIIAPSGPARARPSQQGRPTFKHQDSTSTVNTTSSSDIPMASVSSAMKGSVGLSSALGRPVLLRIRVAAGADVHFTTTISVPTDMYIADLTEILVKKKRLPNPASEWVLCLGDLSLALPLDRTVASLEANTNLALVKRQWAVERGLRIDDRRGGDPSASIFKRISEPLAAAKFGGAGGGGGAAGLTDFSQTYKKYTVQRKIAIGRHERVMAIDGDYIHILPSESRTFFDSTKTTTIHASYVVGVKLTGRAGGFKLNIVRDDGRPKRYEFDAENGKQAGEIVNSIKALMKQYPGEKPSATTRPLIRNRRA